MTSSPTFHPIIRHLWGYLVALGLVGAGFLLCLILPTVMLPRPFLAFWPVLVLAAEFGGKGPGIFATVASVLCIEFIIYPNYGGMNLHEWIGMTAMLIFLGGGLTISLFIGEKLKIQSLQRLQAADIAMREARYRAIFEAANVGKSVTLPTGEIEVNRAFCDMLGYAQEDMHGMTWQQLTPPEEIGPINERLASLLRGEKNAVRFEKRYIHKNGSYVWTDVSVTLLRDGQGRPLSFISTIVDMTEFKRAENERQKFFLLVESSSEFIGMCDLDMTPLYVNPAGLRIVGLTDMAAACQVKVQDYYFPEDQRFIAEEFFPRVMREGHGEVEIRLRHFQTGEPIWMFYYLFSVQDANGTPIGWATVSRDITQRRQAEAALRESEQEFRTLAEAMPQIVWVARADGWNIYFNQQWVDYTGLTLEESYGHGWNKPFHPDDQQRAWNAWQRATEHNAIYSLECRLRNADGAYRWWLVRGVPHRDADGEILKWFGTCTDIEDIKRKEEALRLAETRWQFALEGSNQGVWDWDVASGKVFYSKVWKVMLGYADDEISDSLDEWSKRVHPDDLASTYADLERHWQGETPYYLNIHRVKKRDGQYMWILDRGMVMSRDINGQPLRMIGTHSDVTEMKQTQDMLLEKERFLADSQSIAHVGSWMMTLDENHIVWSEESFRLFGLSPNANDYPSFEEFLNLLHPDDVPAMQTWCDECLAGKQPASLAFRPRPIDGQQRWLLGNGQLENLEDGKPGRMIGTVQDITERKHAEHQLQRISRLYQMLSRANETLIVKQRVEELLQRVCDILVDSGHFRLAWIGEARQAPAVTVVAASGALAYLQDIDISIDAHQPQGQGPLGQAWRHGGPVIINDFISNSGTTPWHERAREYGIQAAASFPLFKNHQVSGILTVYTAEADFFQTEEEALLINMAQNLSFGLENLEQSHKLAKTKALLTAIIDNTPDAIFAKDTEGRYMLVNKGMEALFGRSAEYILGQDDSLVFPTDELSAIRRRDQEVMTKREIMTFEETVTTTLGLRTFRSTKGPLFNGGGALAGMFGLARDITDLKLALSKAQQTNEQLEARVIERTEALKDAKERAERADKLKSTFLATMSHELRTPLNSIIGFTDMMLMELVGPLNEEQTKQLGFVKNSGQHLLALISDILDISKIEAGQLRLNWNTVDVHKLFMQSFETFQPAFAQKGLDFQLHLASELTPLYTDRRRLEQILNNLLSNALKFTERGEVSLSAHQSIEGLTIIVEDTGIGISEASLSAIGKPFTQVDTGLARQHEGTGLGLAISRMLVEGMGGRLEMNSRLGVGSRFSIFLPTIQKT